MKDKYMCIALSCWTVGILGASIASFIYVLNGHEEYNVPIAAASCITTAISVRIGIYFCKELCNPTRELEETIEYSQSTEAIIENSNQTAAIALENPVHITPVRAIIF